MSSLKPVEGPSNPFGELEQAVGEFREKGGLDKLELVQKKIQALMTDYSTLQKLNQFKPFFTLYTNITKFVCNENFPDVYKSVIATQLGKLIICVKGKPQVPEAEKKEGAEVEKKKGVDKTAQLEADFKENREKIINALKTFANSSYGSFSSPYPIDQKRLLKLLNNPQSTLEEIKQCLIKYRNEKKLAFCSPLYENLSLNITKEMLPAFPLLASIYTNAWHICISDCDLEKVPEDVLQFKKPMVLSLHKNAITELPADFSNIPIGVLSIDTSILSPSSREILAQMKETGTLKIIIEN